MSRFFYSGILHYEKPWTTFMHILNLVQLVYFSSHHTDRAKPSFVSTDEMDNTSCKYQICIYMNLNLEIFVLKNLTSVTCMFHIT